jgi:hypothetical protein
MNAELKNRFLSQIETELEFCDPKDTPLICYNYNQITLKKSLIDTIAETAISRRINISQAIAEVEKTYSINDID